MEPLIEFNEYSLNDLLVYCNWYMNDIYVRKYVDGWCTMPISELTGKELLDYLLLWDGKKQFPYRVVREHKVEKPHE